MNITWYGHACFKIESSDGSIVLDPYSNNSVYGLRLPPLSASRVHCSHGHSDHNAAQLVKQTRDICGMKISSFPCYHDELCGKKRGDNLICLIETEGRRIVHLGDLGHMPDDALLKALGRIDILMVPVGGTYTVDAAAAKAVCDRLSPSVIIPMHYRCESTGLRDVAPVSDFLKLFPSEKLVFLSSCELDPDALPSSCIAVFPDPEPSDI